MYSLPLSYMGYAGYLNPFTLESQVNSKIPTLNLITTLLHETAHQMGYASEKEANFIAYYSAIKMMTLTYVTQDSVLHLGIFCQNFTLLIKLLPLNWWKKLILGCY